MPSSNHVTAETSVNTKKAKKIFRLTPKQGIIPSTTRRSFLLTEDEGIVKLG